MTIITNAEKITAWQDANPGARITEAILREILNLETLARAGLRGANLRGADLRGADLTGTDLHGANLYRSLSGILTVRAGASGDGYLKPTPDGWRICIGCWEEKTLEDLDDLIHDRAEWPEAEGSDRNRRRPMLIAVKSLCEAWIGQHPDIITNLDNIWNTK